MNELTDLFYRLREDGFPLGIDQYLLMVRALGVAKRPLTRARLQALGHMLWVEEEDDKGLFDYHFEREVKWVGEKVEDVGVVAEGTEAETVEVDKEIVPNRFGPTLVDERKIASIWAQLDAAGLDETAVEEAESETGIVPEAEVARVAARQDAVSNVKRAWQVSFREEDGGYRPLSYQVDYMPVTRRQMKQNWRYIRRLRRQGALTELDLESTIEKIAREGVVWEPVLRARRVNVAQVLLLVDRLGSMVPFHGLGRQLVETAETSGHLAKWGVYYFHNTPPRPPMTPEPAVDDPYREHTLFRTAKCGDGGALSALVAEFDPSQTGVLIFSDGGAARQRWNKPRVYNTATFLYQLESLGFKRMVWLNPLPRPRWWEAGNTASAVAKLVPMFPLDQDGMLAALKVLR
ncbi:MAG TPA: hypothetical protein VLL52_22730 [Anaerolineae bacterium]|nr:hypothetical protein [Anaerolineae bacterium]